jgi:hypothetical protein
MVNSSAYLEDCVITKNNKNGFAICDSAFSSSSCLYLSHCDVRGNLRGSFVEEKTVLSAEHGNSFSLNSGLNLNSEKGNEEIMNADKNGNNNNNDRMGMVSSVEQVKTKDSNVGDSNNCPTNDQISNINNSDNSHTNNNISNDNDSSTNNCNNSNNNNNNNDNNGSINNMNAGVNTLNNIINTDISSKNTEQLSTSLSASQEHSSSNTVIQERTFFLRKCIGDEDAMKFFKKFEWLDPFNDVEVEVEDDRESPQLVINLVPSNSQKESGKDKMARNSTNLPRSSSLTNINNTGNSKRKRVEDNDTNFKENFDRLFGDYEKDFFEGIEVPDKKDEVRKDEYERCSGVVDNGDVMRVIKKEKREGGKDEIHHDDITMKIEKI